MSTCFGSGIWNLQLGWRVFKMCRIVNLANTSYLEWATCTVNCVELDWTRSKCRLFYQLYQLTTSLYTSKLEVMCPDSVSTRIFKSCFEEHQKWPSSRCLWIDAILKVNQNSLYWFKGHVCVTSRWTTIVLRDDDLPVIVRIQVMSNRNKSFFVQSTF